MNKTFLLYGSVGWLFYWMIQASISALQMPATWELAGTALCIVLGAALCERMPRQADGASEDDWQIEESEVWDE